MITLGPDPQSWPSEWRERYEERAAIMQYDGGLSRVQAEIRAEAAVREQARTAR